MIANRNIEVFISKRLQSQFESKEKLKYFCHCSPCNSCLLAKSTFQAFVIDSNTSGDKQKHTNKQQAAGTLKTDHYTEKLN